ncbi:uncharacterized protein PHACADRAFT_213950 [Phanerochaete carnosa HHB-10118-sp]|uniref:F-box domain-containing protein n=1 Tax=Phanerochaete carnosa (strain HHB-10118-sp) TaxID=650164 RepID=K5UKN0_PHACS|nr:uncharacterized protein PHACADRAFT_213950 [Phanerochaete carnosa HHB-10118-sp]EKM50201.1 hypothetical protein PHACADRAFT_213950 [Phanerochaete carnosa HHB-10118-sp]
MNLPAEIVARIVDELRDHSKALAQCALTNHSWLSYARKVLYHTVTLSSEKRAQHFCSLIHKNLEITNCVRVLKFNVYSYYMSQKQYTSQGLQGWVPSTAALLASRLPSVSTIHFEYIQWQILHGFDRNLLDALSDFAKVRTVRFWACTFATFAEFEDILLALPALRRLQLDSISWGQPLTKPPYTLRLDSLSTSAHYSLQALCQWLDKIQAHTTLYELELDHLYDEDDLRYAGKILSKLDTTLQSLTICCRFSCDGYSRLQDIGQWLRIERSTALRTLRIRVYDLVPEYMHWITKLLRLIEAPNLTTLVFDVCLFMPSQTYGEVWDDIAWLLSESPRYASLRRVRFVHRGPLMMEIAAAALCRQFPILHLRGVLEAEDQRNPDLLTCAI